MENNGILYIYLISAVTSSSVTSKYHFAFGHEMLLGMDFDGREAKLEVRENSFSVS